MFNKKPERPKRRNHGGNLSQYGLFDVPTTLDFNDEDNINMDDNDSDLEAELAALASSGGGAKPKRPPRRNSSNPGIQLDAMIQESLRDIPSDEDEDASGDDDDPDLLNELSEIAGGSESTPESPVKPIHAPQPTDVGKLLQDRLKMYQLAESNAKSAGEAGRARRFARGIKTLLDLIKQNNAGRGISEEDIPPEVTVTIKRPTQTNEEEAAIVPEKPENPVEEPPMTPPKSPERQELSEEKKELLTMLQKRRDQYKGAALEAKKGGDMQTAVNHIKTVKQFEKVMKAIEDGQEVDLSRMPGPPIDEKVTVEEAEPVRQQDEPGKEKPQRPQEQPEEAEAEEEPVALITANSVEEALQQRLEVYKAQEAAAKESGNSSKARRMGRIVKQFEQAIKLNNAGKPIPMEDLPTPPGYAPIPGAPVPTAEPEEKPIEHQPKEEATTPGGPPTPPKRTASRGSGNKQPTRRLEIQLALLRDRQKEFKLAALGAKKKGEIAQAKEYLRSAKGFDPLIEATLGGLPVEIASLPIPPSAKAHLDEYELVAAEECTEDDTGVMDAITRLEAQLSKQLKSALSTRDHHKALGDIAGMNRFEHLALTVTKDLDIVRLSKRTNGAAVPKFHYEKREYSIVKSFTDLTNNDLELTIVRGINYNCSNPKDIDTYVKFEFPNPQEEIVRDKTVTVKDSNNPEYNARFVLAIQRSARVWSRIFKRQSIKFEVYSKGGFLRSDILLGTVTVKLQPLETQCEIHDSFDLMDGRKKVGGKLEVRLRVRDPLVSKEVEQLSERWLVIDH